MLRSLIFIACLLLAAVYDIKTLKIPNVLLIIAILVWVISIAIDWPGAIYVGKHCITALGFCTFMFVLTVLVDRFLHKQSFGMGDIKLISVIALYNGFSWTVYSILIACIYGLIIAVIPKNSAKFPFGPGLALGGIITYLLSLFGL